jgi:hypothetical protein
MAAYLNGLKAFNIPLRHWDLATLQKTQNVVEL